MKLDFRPEDHCDLCGDIAHNHFECPVCRDKDAGTTIYGAIWEEGFEVGDEFECEECGAILELISKENNTDYNYQEWEWEVRTIKEVKFGDSVAILGDCLDVMPLLEEASVDAVITDPPYNKLACKWDIIIPFVPMWEQLNRVIKKDGAIVMTATQPFTSALIMSNQPMFKYCWVWVKTKPSGYQICKVKPLSKFEDIVVFCQTSPVYNPIMVKRDKPRTGMVHSTNNQMKISGGGVYAKDRTYTHRYPTTVIEVANGSQKGKCHPAQKPVALMEYLIKTYTNEGDTVPDFAAGSFTTAIACINTNRKFICIEKETSYFNKGVDRVKAHLNSRGEDTRI